MVMKRKTCIFLKIIQVISAVIFELIKMLGAMKCPKKT